MRRDHVLIPLYLWVSASICIHILSYFGSDEVATLVGHRRAREARRGGTGEGPPPAEVEFTYLPPTPPPSSNVTPPTPDPTQTPSPDHTAVPQHHPETRLARNEPTPQTPHPLVPLVPTPATPPPRPQAPRQHMQFVDAQRNDNQARPDDPAFLAQSNNNVREQTQAAMRNLNRDDPNPQVGGTPSHSRAEQVGNGDEQVSADSRDVAGNRNRVPDRSPDANERHPVTPRLAMNDVTRTPRSGDRSTGAPQQATPRSGAAGDPGTAGTTTPAGTSGADPSVLTQYHGNSSISIASTAGGNGTQGQGGSNGQNGHNGQSANDAAGRVGVRGLGAEGTEVALTPSVRTYEQVYGPEADRERVLAMQRRSRARGSYTESWRENRASIENYIPSVRVGNQTSLRTAQSPFAGYITAMHRRIHRLFADGYLADLGNLPGNSPLNDMSLNTTLEIILERDGRIHRLGVVRTSGNLSFDVAALNSVRHAAPYGNAPAGILSADGRVYMHWGFFRNERQCGPFNADPYILPAPGAPTPNTPVVPPHGPAPADEHGPASVGVRGGAHRVLASNR